MNKRCAAAGLLLCIALGCTPSEPDEGGAGGAVGAGDASVAGLDSSAGTDAAAGADAAVATGADAKISGDTGASGGGNGTADAGGESPSEAGADASDASRGEGDAGLASAAVPSAGCGKGGRPANGVVTATDHIYNFPSDYAGDEPFPLVMALHANGNPNTQLQGLTNGTRLATSFIRVFPKSAGAGWVMSTDAPRITAIFNDVVANHCVDTSRVFLTGHSSGAQMTVQLLCAPAGEKRFKAVAPVAASKYCAKVAPIPVMYIQGMMDMMRGDSNGIDVVNFFTSSNACSSMTLPDTAVAGCSSTFDRAPVLPGCVTYQGCSKPTIWCSHNDNGYNASDGNQHGWPCFASNAMADFFLGLP